MYGSYFCRKFFACSVSYSLQRKRKCSGVSFTLEVEHFGEVSVLILFLWPLISCFQPCNFRNSFSGSIFEKNGSFLWDKLGQYFYILCVSSFPIFWSIYLWRAFCFLVVFQRVIVGCWAVDNLLFFKAVFVNVDSASWFSSIS